MYAINVIWNSGDEINSVFASLVNAFYSWVYSGGWFNIVLKVESAEGSTKIGVALLNIVRWWYKTGLWNTCKEAVRLTVA